MRLTEEGWFNFLSYGDPGVISVGRLPLELCKIIGSSTSLIRMRHDYALKSMHKHRLRPAHFGMLPISIDMGRVVQQRDNHLSFFFYENVLFGGWVQTVIKTDNSGNELWVATFHVSSAPEAKRYAKKHGIIRPEKW